MSNSTAPDSHPFRGRFLLRVSFFRSLPTLLLYSEPSEFFTRFRNIHFLPFLLYFPCYSRHRTANVFNVVVSFTFYRSLSPCQSCFNVLWRLNSSRALGTVTSCCLFYSFPWFSRRRSVILFGFDFPFTFQFVQSLLILLLHSQALKFSSASNFLFYFF